MKDKSAMLVAMRKEIALQKNYLRTSGDKDDKVVIETLYFGGGTPSVLSIDDLGSLRQAIDNYYTLSPGAEITLEANPDDLTEDYLEGLRQLGINRLSIGIQSFFDDDLKWMNRRHNAHEAIQSVELAQLKGFDNINIDLIYGLPSMTQNRWKDNLRQAFDLDILHLSAYHLTIEPRTVFGRRQNKGDNFSINEEDSIRQFECLLDAATEAGFEHYEISNFAKPGFHSRHNSNYWRHLPYLGIGPSAHSYDGKSRQWNVGNNSQYIENIEKEDGWCESELLSPFDMYNDYMLISIRTMWGVNPGYILENFGPTFLEIFLRQAASYIQSGFMEKCNGKYVLTRKGKMIADRIASDLFADEDTMNILETRLKYTGLIY